MLHRRQTLTKLNQLVLHTLELALGTVRIMCFHHQFVIHVKFRIDLDFLFDATALEQMIPPPEQMIPLPDARTTEFLADIEEAAQSKQFQIIQIRPPFILHTF